MLPSYEEIEYLILSQCEVPVVSYSPLLSATK